MLVENARCNHAMKELLVGLFNGATVVTKGWLRRALRTGSKVLKQEEIRLRGYACLVTTKANWRNAILATIY
jgi:hypothetical protein